MTLAQGPLAGTGLAAAPHQRPEPERFGMTTQQDTRPPAVGVYWINEEDYPALLRIFDDGNKMPRTWREWLKIAEEMERGLLSYGHVVLRVRIVPRHSLIGVPRTTPNRAAWGEKSLSLRPSSRDTATK